MSNDTETYVALGVASAAYAGALNTDVGKRFAQEYTWARVVFGTTLVLTMLRFIMPKEEWQKVANAFMVAGTPMIARSLINKIRRLEE